MDPIEFRLKNISMTDPSNGKPFSSRATADALRRGAEMIGWKNRKLEPRQNRSGEYLIGYGVAAGCISVATEPDIDPGQAYPQRKRRQRKHRARGERHRDRHLHDRRPDRGRNTRPADRKGRRKVRRLDFAACGRVGRFNRSSKFFKLRQRGLQPGKNRAAGKIESHMVRTRRQSAS